MLSRLRPSTGDRDKGFTLIELLVVMIIIGILAAIAIPVFLNQRQRAVDSSIKADLRSVANTVETVFVDTQTYPAAVTQSGTTVTVGSTTVTTTTGNTFTYTLRTGGASYAIKGANTGASGTWCYDSAAGGLQTAKNTTCT